MFISRNTQMLKPLMKQPMSPRDVEKYLGKLKDENFQ